MKPRNHIILALIKMNKKSSVHEKSNKAKRRNEKVKLYSNKDLTDKIY